MKPPGNLMILASAGSGKTYALTGRFVRLLAGGAPPERIVALTFTRKAAGEFFDEIVNKLARAAAGGAAARRLALEIQEPDMTAADFLRLLRGLVDAMHRLHLGTLDSFFAQIVRRFPLELGLAGDIAIMDTHDGRFERRRVLGRMFAHAGPRPTPAQQDFIEAFKRATFGVEEKQLARRLDDFLDVHGETYLAAPSGELWGNAGCIWPAGCDWLAHAGGRVRAAGELRDALPWTAMDDKQRRRFETFFADLPAWAPGAPLPDAVAYVVGNALKAGADSAEIVVERRRLALTGPARAALRALVAAVIGAEFDRRLEMTRGIFAILRSYEAVYHDAVRRRGRLTFADVQRLLLPEGGAPVLSATARPGDSGPPGPAGEGRLAIDYRLDAQLDHWLLDEFQDTSDGQWSVLRNLIDEAVQDPTGRRSFFYVGDVKQAIFAWRAGDPRLFREIFDHYNSGGAGAIAEAHLTRSWRSSPAVIAMVNRVFGAGSALARLFPADAARRWTQEWRAHESARPGPRGYSTLRRAEGVEGRFRGTLGVLQEAGVAARGLSAAVLVQRNDTAVALADFLRREGGMPAAAESDLRIGADNPFTCALLALLRTAAHPGDTLAREHVAMTPVGPVLARLGIDQPDALTTRLLGEVHADGFEQTVERWLHWMEPLLAPGDAFSRERGRQLAEAARVFDKTGRRDVGEFCEFAADCAVREVEAPGVVRVMTVHKAKGLGFDLVILPDIEGQRLALRREGLAVQRDRERSVEWVLDLPAKEFCAQDEVLRAHIASAEADACYEALCVLYVAMTRARQAMVVLTEPAKPDSMSMNYPRLLNETLGETWEEGDPTWYARQPGATAPSARVEAAMPMAGSRRRAHRLPAYVPSALPGATISGGALFSSEGGGPAEFGLAVHALLARVEWWDEAEAGAWIAARRAEGAHPAALDEVVAVCRAPELAGVFERPRGPAELWREKAFDTVGDGAWVTGIFDRVIVERDAAGRAARATVFDFKTDRRADADPMLQRHAPQLRMYRRAAARLTGLPESEVGCDIVLTQTRKRLHVA
jgi:ATP-dependent exoDNAse (exonuclease V) beta subunit